MSRISNQEWERRKEIADKFAANVNADAPTVQSLEQLRARLDSLEKLASDSDDMDWGQRQNLREQVFDIRLDLGLAEIESAKR